MSAPSFERREYTAYGSPRSRGRLVVSPRSRDGLSPESCISFAPLSRRGRREGPGARRTRGLVCCVHQKEMRTRAYRFGGSIPAFPAQWLYDLYVLSLATRLSCHHHPRDAKHHREFDANPGASGPHAFIVRKGPIRRAFAPEAFASTAARPNVSDVGRHPLLRDRMRAIGR